MPGRKINPLTIGWEIYEQGFMTLPKISRKIMAILEWMLTENGMGVEGKKNSVKME